MTLPFPADFRLAVDADVGFIVSTWLQSYHDGAPNVRHSVKFRRYKGVQRSVVQRAMDAGHVVIACDPADRSSIYGFACGCDDDGEGVLHYAYVVQTRRRYGLARELLKHVSSAAKRTMTSYSHSTVTGARVAQRLGLSHNPFALVRLLHADRQAVRARWNQDAGARQDHPDEPGGGRGAVDGR